MDALSTPMKNRKETERAAKHEEVKEEALKAIPKFWTSSGVKKRMGPTPPHPSPGMRGGLTVDAQESWLSGGEGGLISSSLLFCLGPSGKKPCYLLGSVWSVFIN